MAVAMETKPRLRVPWVLNCTPLLPGPLEALSSLELSLASHRAFLFGLQFALLLSESLGSAVPDYGNPEGLRVRRTTGEAGAPSV